MSDPNETLYSSVKQLREQEHQPYYRVLLSGFFNEEVVKRKELNIEQYVLLSSIRWETVLHLFLKR